MQIIELRDMIEIDWIALVVAIGGLLGIYVKLEVSIKAIQTRQANMEKELNLLRAMVDKQIDVDDHIKDLMTDLRVGQAKLHTAIVSISERLERNNI